jgi:hypothetical protein
VDSETGIRHIFFPHVEIASYPIYGARQMPDLHKRLAEVKMEHEKTMIQRQIGATDERIARLVYELYELTDEEAKIVEGD